MTSLLSIPALAPELDTIRAALAYADAGFYLLPIRRGSKHPGSVVGKRWQDQSSRDPQVIAAWFAGTDHGLAIHLGRSGAVAFDVDDPDAVPDVLVPALAIAPFQSSRPDVRGKGHYLFTQPPGRLLGNGTGRLGGAWGEVRGRNGIIVVWPTPHPDGGRYAWQRAGELPVLPNEIADYLDDASPSADAATDTEVASALAQWTGNERPDLVDIWEKAFAKKVAAGESRHARMVSVLVGALKEAAVGYFPAEVAASRLEVAFIDAVMRPPKPGSRQGPPRPATEFARAEFAGILAWAVAQARAADPAATRRRVNAKAPDEAVWDADDRRETGWKAWDQAKAQDRARRQQQASGEDAGAAPNDAGSEDDELFWQSRPSLDLIRRWARARRAGPWATLAVVLARVVARAGHTYALPAAVGGEANLDLYLALVAFSSGGKGSAEKAAAAAVRFRGGVDFRIAGPGSGEGLGHLFSKRTREGVERIAYSAYVSVTEVETLTALTKGRQGSTLLQELRRSWSAEGLGFHYADPAKSLPLAPFSYRLCVCVGVQPAKSGPLLDDSEAGTPQRFGFFPTHDHGAPRRRPPDPPQIEWSPPHPLTANSSGRAVMPVCAEALEAIDEAAYLRQREGPDAQDGHALLCRLKFAAALALLEGRNEVRADDWALAGRLMEVSVATRERCRAVLTDQARKANVARAEAEGERAKVIDERRLEGAVQRVARGIRRYLMSRPGEGWVTRKEIRGRFSGDDRRCASTALEHLLATGSVEVEEVPGQGRPMVRYRWAER